MSVPVPDEDREKAIYSMLCADSALAEHTPSGVGAVLDALIALGWAPRPVPSGAAFPAMQAKGGAFYRPDAPVPSGDHAALIATAAELDALPLHTVIRGRYRDIAWIVISEDVYGLELRYRSTEGDELYTSKAMVSGGPFLRLADALEAKEAEFVDRRIVEAQALMDARHLVIGTPGFDALTARSEELRKAAGQ